MGEGREKFVGWVRVFIVVIVAMNKVIMLIHDIGLVWGI